MRRPLFWLGTCFLSSTAVFLHFSFGISLFLCAAIAFAALLFSGASGRKALALFCLCAIAGLLWAKLYTIAVNHYLAPVLSGETRTVTFSLTATELNQRGSYCQWSGRGTVTAKGISRTFPVVLRGYTEEETAIGLPIQGTARLNLPFEGQALNLQLITLDEPPTAAIHPFTQTRIQWQQALSDKAYALSDDVHISGVLSALLTGDRTCLLNEINTDFRKSGLSHLLVVSGLHLVLVSRLVLLLLTRIFSPRRANLISVLFCWTFAAISGMGSSVIRAAVMLTLVHLAEAANRRSDTLTSLMVAALLMALVNPYVLFSAAFLLSFSAVAGLATLEKPLLSLLKDKFAHTNAIGTHFLQNLSVGIAAQAGAAPVLIWIFGTVPLFGIIANLAAIWLIEPVMLLGLVALFLSLFSPALAAIVALPCTALVRLLLFVAQLFARLPFAQLGFTERWQTLWMTGSLILLILLMTKRLPKPSGKLAVIGCTAVGLTAAVVFSVQSANTAEIILFKNSSSAVLVKGSHAIVFGSPQNGYQLYEIQTALDRLGVEFLDAVVIESAAQATYQTAALMSPYPQAVLCSPATRSTVTFSHAAGIPLKHLPDNTVLFNAALYEKSSEGIFITFSEAQLLKTDGNYVIIGRYAVPKPFSETVLRARVKL